MVAAITNQGSRLAAETLYDFTREKGDANGFYDIGIGLGELIPDEEVLPYIQELALKRDKYSHLAVKAMLNEGLEGLQMVFDVLSNSPNPDFDRKMLEDAVDHVYFEDDIEAFVKKTASTSKEPMVVEFAKNILDDFNSEEDSDSDN